MTDPSSSDRVVLGCRCGHPEHEHHVVGPCEVYGCQCLCYTERDVRADPSAADDLLCESCAHLVCPYGDRLHCDSDGCPSCSTASPAAAVGELHEALVAIDGFLEERDTLRAAIQQRDAEIALLREILSQNTGDSDWLSCDLTSASQRER